MTEDNNTHLPRILAVIALGAWILLLYPFPVTTFLATCVSCVLYPWYARLTQRFKGSWPAVVYAMVLVCATALPIAAVVTLVAPQAVYGLSILDHVMDANFFRNPMIRSVLASADEWLKSLPGIDIDIKQIASNMTGVAGSAVRTVLSHGVGLTSGLFNGLFVLLLFVMISTMCVMRGPMIREFAIRLSGFPTAVIERFIVAVRNAVRGVLLGIVLVAMIQGFLCGVGFSFAGVPQPAFWGLLAAFVAPIPFVGTSLVWIPAVVWLWVAGTHTASIGLLLWCVLAVTSVDNVLRPMFLKTGINATFVALILSILLGMAAFGPVGIFAGPVAVAVAVQAGVESSALDTKQRKKP